MFFNNSTHGRIDFRQPPASDRPSRTFLSVFFLCMSDESKYGKLLEIIVFFQLLRVCDNIQKALPVTPSSKAT